MNGGQQTVLLRHEFPDGTWHFDWMLDLDPRSEALLTSFRTTCRVDQLQPGERVDVERIADHRRDYLDFEGVISGGRGRVRRVARGRLMALQAVADAWGLLIAWGQQEPPHHVLISRAEGSRWVAARRLNPSGATPGSGDEAGVV